MKIKIIPQFYSLNLRHGIKAELGSLEFIMFQPSLLNTVPYFSTVFDTQNRAFVSSPGIFIFFLAFIAIHLFFCLHCQSDLLAFNAVYC